MLQRERGSTEDLISAVSTIDVLRDENASLRLRLEHLNGEQRARLEGNGHEFQLVDPHRDLRLLESAVDRYFLKQYGRSPEIDYLLHASDSRGLTIAPA